MKKSFLFILLLTLPLLTIGQDIDSLRTLIFQHFDNEEYHEVISLTNKALEYYENKNDLFNMAGCHNTLGNAYQRLGQLEEAIANYQRCGELMDQLKEQGGDVDNFYEKNIRYTLNNMANIYLLMGDFEASERMFKRCMEMVGEPVEETDYQDLATYLMNLASVYLRQAESLEGEAKDQKKLEAVDFAEQSLKYSQEHNDRFFKVVSRRIILSEAYFATGRSHEAFEQIGIALDMAEEKNDPLLQTDIHSHYGNYYSTMGDFKASADHYEKAIEIADAGQFEDQKTSALLGAYEATKHFDKGKALEYLEESVKLKEKIFNENQQALIRDFQVKYNMAETTHQLELQQQKNKLNTQLVVLLAVLLGLMLGFFLLQLRYGNILKRLNKTKDHLLSVTSHDIKTSIIAQSMVLDQMYQHCDSMDENELKNNLLILKTSSDALKSKLTNILQWIMDELGHRKPQVTTFNLCDLVNNSASSFDTLSKVKGIKVINEVPPGLECTDDYGVASIVLQNLLGNAIKFTPQEGTVHVEAQEEGEKIWLLVKDNGIGIPKEKLDRLTKEIVRPGQGTLGETGTGLGLLVCRQLLSHNKGGLRIVSQEGEGTTVKFSVNKGKKA